jgi:hypothetical protein
MSQIGQAIDHHQRDAASRPHRVSLEPHSMSKISNTAVSSSCMVMGGCSYIAEHTAPKKQASPTRTAAALKADELFWASLHGGQYEQIQPALEAQTAAFLANPDDAVSAAHVGFLHIWRISERRRLTSLPATITDDATLARKYFQDAVDLQPADARYLGFLASATLIEGTIHQDERLTRRGYFMLLDSIKAWPEFNLFTAGYIMSRQPADSERFKQALDWQWQNIDVCVGERVDRKAAEYGRYMHLQTSQGSKRVCWNSPIAPHNFEGFFLNMGDMLVKSGDWQGARIIYGNARLSATYSQWKYRPVLEERIRDAPDNVALFRSPDEAGSHGDKQMMAASSFSCMACHEQ